jgi:hypothetical protein
MAACRFVVDPMKDVADRFSGTPGFLQLFTLIHRELAASVVH